MLENRMTSHPEGTQYRRAGCSADTIPSSILPVPMARIIDTAIMLNSK